MERSWLYIIISLRLLVYNILQNTVQYLVRPQWTHSLQTRFFSFCFNVRQTPLSEFDSTIFIVTSISVSQIRLKASFPAEMLNLGNILLMSPSASDMEVGISWYITYLPLSTIPSPSIHPRLVSIALLQFVLILIIHRVESLLLPSIYFYFLYYFYTLFILFVEYNII